MAFSSRASGKGAASPLRGLLGSVNCDVETQANYEEFNTCDFTKNTNYKYDSAVPKFGHRILKKILFKANSTLRGSDS